jgi:hypothetical protein
MDNMTNVFIMLGGIAAFAVIITILDALGRRQQRRNARKNQPRGSVS